MAKRLRSGYTTGACAAAAAKAATMALLTGEIPARVEIPFPDGSRVGFALCRCQVNGDGDRRQGLASVVKDAGDDPDVTNGAEIVAVARRSLGEGAAAGGVLLDEDRRLLLRAGSGVGMVTKPGLAVPVGEPAINPVPRRMIHEAVCEALEAVGEKGGMEITVSVEAGEELAAKTLNQRLGIVGGLSILGTTGIVRPVSAEAWTATISASMSVAREAGLTDIVLATGRTSERAAQGLLNLPDEAHAMMGDYLAFALKEAARHGFGRIHLAAMWAKVMKAAMEIPQTHVRHGALEAAEAVRFLKRLGVADAVVEKLAGVNTAREIHERLTGMGREDIIAAVCLAAKAYAEKVSGLPVSVYLVAGSGKVVAHV
ncbi:MAG: cobalt-precorrin-5B (C(1))-methyltransferase [Desulfobulbaceae bacterium]|nr:cobalt-precorrin-5B (C(1))-methyltransferase [Desulfobulbaceae bacterium]